MQNLISKEGAGTWANGCKWNPNITNNEMKQTQKHSQTSLTSTNGQYYLIHDKYVRLPGLGNVKINVLNFKPGKNKNSSQKP